MQDDKLSTYDLFKITHGLDIVERAIDIVLELNERGHEVHGETGACLEFTGSWLSVVWGAVPLWDSENGYSEDVGEYEESLSLSGCLCVLQEVAKSYHELSTHVPDLEPDDANE